MRLFSVLVITGGAIALCAACSTTAIDTGTGGSGGTGGDAGVPCSTLVCMNGGVCVDVDGMPECDCDGTGYEGDECENDVDECPDDVLGPCDETGTASCDGTMPAGSYTCMCNDGYEGDNCETDTDECDGGLGPCDSNGASACNGASPAGSYTCTCNTGYTGMDCDECAEGYVEDSGSPGTCILDPCPDGDPDSSQSYTPASNTPIGGVNPLNVTAQGLRISAIPQSPPTAAKIITSVTGVLGISDPGAVSPNNALFITDNETADIAFFEDDAGTLTTARTATEIEITINTFPAPTSSIPIDISAFDTGGSQIGTTLSASYTASAGPIDVSALFSEAPIHRVRITATTSSAFNVKTVAFIHECL